MGSEPKLIKVCLTNQGEDTETPWAHDLGPAPGSPPGSRKARLVNVPFMHAKPTWGDVVVVSPVADGFPTWDRGGIPWKQISSKIVEDGGRWAMIVDYVPHPGVADDDAYRALATACDAERLVCEGAWGPRDAEPGRVYLAVTKELAAEAVMQRLLAQPLPMQLIQIHPEPKKLSRAQTQLGITAATPRKPAAPAATPKAAAKPAATSTKPVSAEAPRAAPKPAPAKPAAKPAHATKSVSAETPKARPKPTPAKPVKKAAPAKKPAAKAKKPAAKAKKPAAKAKKPAAKAKKPAAKAKKK